MTTEENKATIRRFLEAWNTRSVSTMEALADKTYAPEYITNDRGQPASMMGLEGCKQYVRNVLKNIPDIQITIENLIAEGDRVVFFVTIRGTNAQSGKPVHSVDMEICRFANGLVAENWSVYMPVEPRA
jgi:ketosteroid isomerase-like protein